MDKRFDELEKLALPLKKYLEVHYDPHCEVVVGYDCVKVVRSEMQALFTPTPHTNKPN